MLVYDGVDPQGGLQYSRYERTRVEGVFKETMKKEKDIRDKYPIVKTFQMNLANGQTKGSILNIKRNHNPNMIITEKVEKGTPLERNTIPAKRSAADEYGNTMIRHNEKPSFQKIDLPQSRAQEIGWLIAASMTSDQINAQRRQSTRENPVGRARIEAYRSASLADLSGGKLGVDASPTAASTDKRALKESKLSRSAPQLPRLIPHLPDEGPRPELRNLNNPRWRKPQSQCELTHYADHFYAVMRCSPFNQAAARGGKHIEPP